MSSLISLSIKAKDGSFKNYTISISDETNQWGQNVAMYESQTKEEREAKAPKKYIGNGKVVWTDGKIVKGEDTKPATTSTKIVEDQEDDLFF